ncbi:hypothetical protein FC35_GL000674 [Limosilactobacillus coleohominis DSM 14060]|nr:hypothetical protein FC35_GL000674 [Limosilactobacillus coleohominis DSM 14060]
MGALVELVKESSEADRQEMADILRPYLAPKDEQPHVERLLTLKEFQQELPVPKRLDWVRNDLFYQCPALKQFAFNLNAGKGRKIKINPQALDWINNHMDDIDWRG